jgi:DNA-binding transcriptional LysR family regulator
MWRSRCRTRGAQTWRDRCSAARFDLAFVGLFADQSPTGLVHSVVTDEPLVAVVMREHPLAGRPTVRLDELAASGPFIETRPESGLRLQVDVAFERAGVSRTVAFELGSSDAVVRFAGLGFGAALAPASAAVAATGVAVLTLPDPRARHPISIVHQAPEPSAPSARSLLALLREQLAGSQDD